MTDYSAHWGDLVPPLAVALRDATRSLAFLHLPKTGGTSAGVAIATAPGWQWIALPTAAREDPAGAALRARLERRGSTAPHSVAVGLPHETYDAIRWLDSALRACGASFEQTWMPVRPVRARLASAFADYWTQVARARAHADGTAELDPTWAAVTQGYLEDSRHYRSGDGPINGRAWFRSFGCNGPGVPFFLSEVFGGGPESMLDEVRSGRLRITATAGIDERVRELTGLAPATRRRVSDAAADPAVRDAIAAASREIDQLASRDAGFDRAIAALLDDDSFLPGTGDR